MKHISLILVCLFCLKDIRAQLPQGKFCEGEFGQCILFDKNGSFTYTNSCGDCGRSAGQGVAQMKEDTLLLDFNSTCHLEYQTDSSHSILAGEDSNRFSFSFFVQPAQPGIASSPILKTDFLFLALCDSNGNIIRRCGRDSSGNCRLNFSDREMKCAYLQIQCLGYNMEWLELEDLPVNSGIRVFLAPGENTIPPWTVFRYKIVFIANNKMELIPLRKEYTTNTGIIYRK